MVWGKKPLTPKQQAKAAEADAKRDMKREGIDTNPSCRHAGTWNSRGPLVADDGRHYVEYRCPDCGSEMPRYYYP